LLRNCLLKHVIEGKTEEMIQVTDEEEDVSIYRKILSKIGYCKLKEQALDRTLCRTRFGIGYGLVVRD
jgi:hypothetical protein